MATHVFFNRKLKEIDFMEKIEINALFSVGVIFVKNWMFNLPLYA